MFDNSSRSRELAYLLRHDKEYKFPGGAWRSVADLCENHSFAVEEIVGIVSNDNKGRYELNEDNTKVRALYGHSVKVNLMLPPQKPPQRLLHGTASKYILSILTDGIISRSRQYVHLTEDRDMAMNTGARHGDAVVIEIDSHAMFLDGYDFYRTYNGVWLTKEVPAEYIISQ